MLAVARIAGIMGAKQTSNFIPVCHPLPLSRIAVDFDLDMDASAVRITAEAKTTGKTGVEMEALTAVSISALTIYDMCKAVDRGMRIEGVRLTRKSGGQSGFSQRLIDHASDPKLCCGTSNTSCHPLPYARSQSLLKTPSGSYCFCFARNSGNCG